MGTQNTVTLPKKVPVFLPPPPPQRGNAEKQEN